MLKKFKKTTMLLLPTLILVGSVKAGFVFPGPKDLFIPKDKPVIPEVIQREISLYPDSLFRIWIFFTDKGIKNEGELKVALSKCKKALTPRCIKRRMKVRPIDNLVDFRDLPVRKSYVQRVLSMGFKKRAISKWLNAMSVEAYGRDIKRLTDLPFVRAIRKVAGHKRRKDIIIEGSRKGKEGIESHCSLDYGPSFNQLNQIGVPPLHELGYRGDSIVILMLDTGFRRVHESLQHLHILKEHDFINDDDTTWNQPGDPEDQDHHGTITLSTIAGYSPGNLIGPAYNAYFLLAKTEDVSDEQPIEEDWWVEGLEWGDSLGAEIVSSSLGYIDWYTYEDLNGDFCVTTVAADLAAQDGILVVNAMGNGGPGPGTLIAPADADSIVAVGAVDSSGEIASFSSRGPTYDGRIKPEVCAQGVATYCAMPGDNPGDYIQASGTSLSTPLVAGLSALLLQIHPEWGPMDIREALISTASQSDNPNNDYGWGIANGFSASGIEVGIPLLQSVSLLDTFPEDNQDGNVSPGERVAISFTLFNFGNIDIPSLEGVLESSDDRIILLDTLLNFGFLPVGDSVVSTNQAVIEVPGGQYPGFTAHFTLEITDTSRTWEREFVIPVRSEGDWIKAAWNPIIESGERWFNNSILNGSILKMGDTLKLWFSGLDYPLSEWGTARIGYAYSIDGGHDWNLNPDPVLEPGNGWDSWGVMGPAVVPSGDSLLMYYVGYRVNYGRFSSAIGLAKSHDGIHWTKRSQSVIKGNESDWDYNPVGRPSLYSNGDSIFIFYSALDSYGEVSMGKAISRDYVNWSEREPLFGPRNSSDEDFDDLSMKDPWVLKENSWFLFYAGKGADGVWRIGSRRSQEAGDWSYQIGPGLFGSFLEPGVIGSWDYRGVSSPSIIKLDDGTWLMLYLGIGEAKTGLGLAFNTSTLVKEEPKVSQRHNASLKVQLFPNPAVNTLNLDVRGPISSDKIKIRIYGIDGRMVFSKNLDLKKEGRGPWKIKGPIARLSNGVYFVRVETGKSSAFTRFILLH